MWVRSSTLNSTIKFGDAIAPQNSVSTTSVEKPPGWRRKASIEQQVRADVSAVPVGIVREEHHGRPLVGDDLGDAVDRSQPMIRLFQLRCRVDSLQPCRGRGDQIEAEVIARGLELTPARLLPVGSTSLCHGDVRDPHSGLTDQAQGKPANDALVVRMGREDERARRVSRQHRPGRSRKSAERVAPAVAKQAIELRDEGVVRVHGATGLSRGGSRPRSPDRGVCHVRRARGMRSAVQARGTRPRAPGARH